jgi:hypothetical protein
MPETLMKQTAVVALITITLILCSLGIRDSINVGAATPVPTIPTLVSNRVTFSAGWNIVDAAVAFQITTSLGGEPAYTFAAGDTTYQTVAFDKDHPPSFSPSGPGYWVFVPVDTQASVPQAGPMRTSLHVDPGWTMVACGTGFPVRITGAGAVWLYDPATGVYQSGNQLGSGQGAWVYSAGGADITFSP